LGRIEESLSHLHRPEHCPDCRGHEHSSACGSPAWPHAQG
jgi:hypothetical protein